MHGSAEEDDGPPVEEDGLAELEEDGFALAEEEEEEAMSRRPCSLVDITMHSRYTHVF